ncbi:MAG: SagB/ThcOx family dehydrogenase [Patescibacteria group bacterium]|nr:SagB/ThcOx family dehydrogenase [Patescibacteria group bacterium]
MKVSLWLVFLIALAFLGGSVFVALRNRGIVKDDSADDIVDSVSLSSEMKQKNSEKIKLPDPRTSSEISVEEAIAKRRSRREFTSQPLSAGQISQILWAVQGITGESSGHRAAPSAGALYPLEVYMVAKSGGVSGYQAGVYHYLPLEHSVEKIGQKDLARDLAAAALGQSFIADAPISLVITAKYSRVTNKYGERGRQYVHMEAGHAAQNVYLQVETLGLGTVVVGAFDGERIVELLQIPAEHEPLYVMPIGNLK